MSGIEPQRLLPAALLFQTGYLTIKRITRENNIPTYHMDYPNREVREAFLSYILSYHAPAHQSEGLEPIAAGIGKALRKGDIDAFCKGFSRLFASIPYGIFLENREAYYHTVVYLVLGIMGVKTACEIQTNRGRIDAVLETDDRIYVVEFKLGTAREALDQIHQKDYAAPWRNGKKPVYLLGIGLIPEKRNIGDWLCFAPD